MTRAVSARGWLAHPTRGQSLIIVALMFVVLFGFAGLALDAGHLYLVHRKIQNAVDAAALAAGKRLVGGNFSAPPSSSTANIIEAAYDFTWSNGFPTTFNVTCDATTAGTPNRFHTVWFDTNGGTCAAPTGYTTRVDVYLPPRTLVSTCTSVPYNCVEVVITQQVQNYLMGVLGQPITVVTASASAFGDPAGSVVTLPPPYAMYLYEPGPTSCVVGMVCFNQLLAPSRSSLSCGAGSNCPTLWVQPGTSPLFKGINGTLLNPPGDTVGVQSNGNIVLQDATGTTFCDPYGGATCTPRTVTGTRGFSINGGSGAKLYCSSFVAPGSAAGNTPCTTTGPGTPPAAIGPVYANEYGFTASSWPHTPDTSGLPNCGALVLNGESVASHYGAPPAACAPNAAAPYTVQPGQYQSIVINHGFYVFGAGMYYITGLATVNTNATGTANGIDHSLEQTAAGTDWDLCNGLNNVLACPTLQAGVWIGHGKLNSSPFVFPVSGACPLPVPVDGGGGDPTEVIGGGVSFVFGPSSGGFVSTNEVSYIDLVGPGLGAQPKEQGAPILFDIQNDSFTHLDANTAFGFGSNFRGLIYQRSTAQGGGVEVNPGLGAGQPAISGMVWAYSLTTFGQSGIAVDFSGAFGGNASAPNVSGGDDDGEGVAGGGGGGGSTEPQILTGASLQAAPGKPGYEQVIMTYADEWKLDAYSAFVTVNGGKPVFFSQGVWNPVPTAGAPLPPAVNNPGDSNPADPNVAQDIRNSYTINAAPPGKNDWVMNYPTKAAPTSYFEVSGDWTWGHQQGMAGQNAGSYTATLTYTFPIPSGTTVTISMFMTDGDRCGDTAIQSWTFNNVGYPGAGQQVLGTVHLVQ